MFIYFILAIMLVAVACYCYVKGVKSQKAMVSNCDYDMYFEPHNPIKTPEEFTKEIMAYFLKENKFVTVLDESMEPRILWDGQQYICRLGEPLNGKVFGNKWVYIYKL